jgi:serine protease AprX
MTGAVAFDARRARRLFVAFAVSCVLVTSAAPAVQALGRQISVIVTSTDTKTAGDLVFSEHGTVTYPLPMIQGVIANVPASRLADLSSRAVVVPNRAISLTAKKYDAVDASSLVSTATSDIGAPTLWSHGITGAGETVALIDTGVAHVADLADHIVAEANITTEPTAEDTFGHGTFQAGLIAGDGTSSNGKYVGVAPNAGIMSIKVADASGSTSLGQVLIGAQLVDGARKRFNVDVALLAISSESPLPPELDPLTRALRRLWADGITVVVPAGNDGPDAGTIGSPGEDPVLLTAGSVNDNGTGTPLDDTMSAYSSRGPTRWGMDKPDVVAPGEHLVSLRAPGSTVDNANPGSRVGDAYVKGSGTSMSAAVTAGAAALVSAAHKKWSPDQIKAVFMAQANPLPDADGASQGAGVIDVVQSVLSSAPTDLPDAPDMSDSGDAGSGRMQWDGRTWDGRTWAGRSWDARSWDARTWDGRSWDARTWDGRTWDARTWEARQWAARTWAARTWAARTWAARTWDARSWDGRSWDSRTWDGRSWDSRSWDGRSWDSRTWDARSWEARQWDSRSWDSRTWEAAFFTSRSWDSRTWESRSWESRTWESRTWESRQWESADWS